MSSPLESNSEEPLEALEATADPTTPIWRIVPPSVILAILLCSTFILKLQNLDHTALTRWDEVFHAVVAQNVLKHPLKPTLIDQPYLPYDHTKWGENHVWLHKPIMPFWLIALSFAVYGVSAFALRLPSVILSTGAALLTYFIGKELFRERRVGLIAAGLQAANPFLMTLIHGYQFADHIDVALLFWVETAIYFLVRALRTGAWTDILLAGVAQGLAFLCKSYPAAIVFGVALSAWLLPLVGLAKPWVAWSGDQATTSGTRATTSEDRATTKTTSRIGPLRLIALLGATLLTVAPWLLFCMASYPDEFWHEHSRVWHHLKSNVEGWGAPWDRLIFDYLIVMYGVFYTPIAVAVIALVHGAVAQRHNGLWLTYAWGFGVLAPHVFAATKTPSATVLAMPAFLLLLSYLVAESSRGIWRGDRWLLAALTATLVMSLVMPAVIRPPGHGYPPSRAFGTVMGQSMWVIHHVWSAFSIAGALAVLNWIFALRPLAGRGRILGRSLQVGAVLFCCSALLWLGYLDVERAWRVTTTKSDDPDAVEVGQFVRENLPENAVLLCDVRRSGIPVNRDRRYEHLSLQFYADRTCYGLQGESPDRMARHVVQAGGVPYVVSHRRLPLQAVHVSPKGGPTIYRWTDP